MKTFEWHPELPSTMIRAAELAAAGAESGSIAGATLQTAGLGRHGHTWHSGPGGLYFTIILRPNLDLRHLPVVTLAIGVAVADALQMFAGVSVDIRWPNDILIGDRKLAGILAQYHDGAVLAGIGINVSQPGFPPELRDIATSLVLETGAEHNHQTLMRAIAGSVESHVRILESGGNTPILRLFSAASSYVSGKRVRVDLPTGERLGTTAGLTPDGFLLLRTDSGEEITITAGGVRPAYSE